MTKTLFLFKELELGVSGIIKKVPTVIPSASVVERCSELISDNDKIRFQIEDKVSNILMGDLILYKNGETKSLRNVLCREGLVIVNEKFFESKFFQKCFNSYWECFFLDIKFSALDYMKTHNAAMLKGFKTFKRKTNYTSDCDSSASKSAISDLEEFDVETMVTLFPT